MKKDAYYFPHFCNARNDRKIKRVMKELGVEGYGIYFMLLETLREQTNLKYPLEDIDLLADEFGTSEQKIRTVICNYLLFSLDKQNNFFSKKFNEYLKPYFEKSERARVAARKRWDANAYANALQIECKSNASKVKESKVKESKVNIKEALLKSETDFKLSLNPFFDTYSKKMVDEFFEYWSEPNKSNTKLRYQLEKTWQIDRRLKRWASNDFNSGSVATEMPDAVKEYLAEKSK